MGRKGVKRGKRDSFKPKRLTQNYETPATDDAMDDEIDAFHKQRDVVPLDVNEDMVDSDIDTEQPVFNFEEADEDVDNDEDDVDNEIEDGSQLTGLAAKIARQQKYLLAKTGGVEDEMHDDAEEVEGKKAVWGRGKRIYYDADNIDYELQSSDEDLPAEEEAEVLRLQKEKAKYLSMEDFGLEDVSQDASDGEPKVEEILSKVKSTATAPASKETQDDIYPAYEEVKKDLEALSKDEQMDVVYSSAPELVGLLSELNDALEQLENKVNPFLCKVREEKNTSNRGMHYLEVKQLLLLAYCQAISFYLLLKSEGQPVRDHPVIARLVEIKNLLAKINQLDEHLPSGIEEILNRKGDTEMAGSFARENDILESNSFTKEPEPSSVSTETQEAKMPCEATELVLRNLRKDDDNKAFKRKCENDQVGAQSMEMLKVRAALEKKLKLKGFSCSIARESDKVQKHLKPVINGQLETYDDFDDDTVVVGGGTHGKNNGLSGSLHPNKISQVLTPQLNKPKVVSGDDDLPKRDDIGERRRKHELRVLAGAGINSVDDVEDGSEDEFYKQAKAERTAKLAAKAGLYSRASAMPSLPEIPIDGKRQITNQMEKNRGLTRARKKLTKNPRKKYKLKHQKAVIRRKGQVREIRRPSGPYGGEETGINAGISRSIRFKN